MSANDENRLEPVVNENSKILVLGSLPGDQSIQAGQYYANPRNHFWNIMSAILDETLPLAYDERIAMLSKHGIALWDVLHCANRNGSLDNDICDEQANDIPSLPVQYPNIKFIVLNGEKAAKTLKNTLAM